MRLTKFGHSCIRLEHGETTVVVDPGSFTEPEAVDGVDAVLITHEHVDHWEASRLTRAQAPIFTIGAVAEQLRRHCPELLDRVQVVRPGDQLDLGPGVDFEVEVVGEKHAVIYSELPHFDNSGFLFDIQGRALFHPGDALTVPERPVDLLFLPVSAPWLKASDCIDYGRAVGAATNIGIHEKTYSSAGLGIVEGHLNRFLGDAQSYELVPSGADIPLAE